MGPFRRLEARGHEKYSHNINSKFLSSCYSGRAVPGRWFYGGTSVEASKIKPVMAWENGSPHKRTLKGPGAVIAKHKTYKHNFWTRFRMVKNGQNGKMIFVCYFNFRSTVENKWPLRLKFHAKSSLNKKF